MLFAWTQRIAFLIFGVVAAATYIPELHNSIWQDEAYSILHFHNRPFFYSFTQYPRPNHHPLFNAAMSLIWDPGDPIVHARFALLIWFVATLAIYVFAVNQLFGFSCAVLAAAVFGASNITHAFALQIRGYGFSWLFVSALLWLVPQFCRSGRISVYAAILALQAAIVATIPTNVFVSLFFAAWGIGTLLLYEHLPRHVVVRRGFMLAITPIVGFVAYLGLLPQLTAHATRAWSDWTSGELIWHWLTTLAKDFPWLLLVVPVCFAQACFMRDRGGGQSRGPRITPTSLFVVCLITAIVGSLAIVPQVPFPRTYVPFLPLISLTIAVMVDRLLSNFRARAKLRYAPLAFFSIAILGYAQTLSVCAKDRASSVHHHDLCVQHYRGPYYPELLANDLQQIATHDPLLVVSSTETTFALQFLIKHLKYKSDYSMLYYKRWPEFRNRVYENVRIVFVANSEAELNEMLAPMGYLPAQFERLSDRGYFKIFALINTR